MVSRKIEADELMCEALQEVIQRHVKPLFADGVLVTIVVRSAAVGDDCAEMLLVSNDEDMIDSINSASQDAELDEMPFHPTVH